jgi:hypothetical protein
MKVRQAVPIEHRRLKTFTAVMPYPKRLNIPARTRGQPGVRSMVSVVSGKNL